MAPAGLPTAFEARMRELLGPEAPAFLDSFRRPVQRAVRANPLKLDPAELPGLLGIAPDPVPWCREAWFLPEGARPGDSLAHAAGLFYLQEPSALAVGEALDLRPGQRVLDLAAAPGGKATLAAGRLGDRGVVVANELQRGRVQALADNLDRWGSWRTVLAGETVARLAERLGGGFDRVLLDAPCSGEGLFRRNPAAAAQWRPGHVRGSAERQRGLLADAARLVRPGGVLVYSTCTFAPEENEQQVAGFLAAHPGWELQEIPWHEGFTTGRPDWSPGGPPELARTVRLWPHQLRGEGHFIAKLGRPGEPGTGQDSGAAVEAASPRDPGSPHGNPAPRHGDPGGVRGNPAPRYGDPGTAHGNPAPRHGDPGGARGNPAHRGRGPRRGSLTASSGAGPRSSTGPGAVVDAWWGLVGDALRGDAFGERFALVTAVGERVYAVPDQELAGAGVRLLRPGLLLGRARPGRFEPAHALAMAGGPETARQVRAVDDGEAAAWLRGETLDAGGPAGWTLVAWNGWPLGWGRAAGGTLKNHYPKGLRTMRPAHA